MLSISSEIDDINADWTLVRNLPPHESSSLSYEEYELFVLDKINSLVQARESSSNQFKNVLGCLEQESMIEFQERFKMPAKEIILARNFIKFMHRFQFKNLFL